MYAGGSFTTPESVTAGPFVYVRLVGVSEVKLVMSGRNGAKSGKTLSSEASHDLNRISLDPVSVDGEVSAKVLEPAVQVAKPESKYFSSDKLTTRPYPLTHLEIRDIPEMHLGELSGKLVLKVWIDANGDVAATESEFTDLPLSVHEAAVVAFRRMRFAPGQINGQPVGSVIEIEIVPDSLGFPLE